MRVYDVDKDLNLTNPQEFARPDSGDFFDGFRQFSQFGSGFGFFFFTR